jgi:hypothetical protein
VPRIEATSFDTLRTWDGEQSRAFEELSFQLLKEKVTPGTQAIRTGNPDGGVEWYAMLPMVPSGAGRPSTFMASNHC